MNDSDAHYSHGGHETFADKDGRILQALEVIHNPRSANAIRQSALEYLENFKLEKRAPYHGFTLASEKHQPGIVRHFGLSLLEIAVRHQWVDFNIEQQTAVQDWVLQLAQSISEDDPLYIRNKIAELWAEIAKRSWVLDWMNMDELLVRLWGGLESQKLLVLTVLETLSEDIFKHEDPAAGLRGADLNRACVEIFTPAVVLMEQFPSRETSVNVRYGEQGWLDRIGDLLEWSVSSNHISDTQQSCAVQSLSTYQSVMDWVIPKALVKVHAIQRICQCLATSNLSIQMAAIDALYTLYNRSRFSEDELKELVTPLYGQEIIDLLRRLYEWSVVDAADIDEAKYLLSKKLSEMMFNVGRLVEEKPSLIPQDRELGSFLDLLISIVKHQSLHVSIPALDLWVKLLGSSRTGDLPAVVSRIGSLLEICSQRLLRYEALIEDSSNPSILFLNEDVDTMPERHAFLGNYARFCNQIVEIVVQKRPVDALYHILSQADHVLDHLYDGEPPFQPQTYSKTSIPLLRLDSQFSVVEAALKGYAKWLLYHTDQALEREHAVMTSNMKVWCDRLISLTFEDPLIKERVIQLAVGFAIGPLKRHVEFAFKVFEYILNTQCPDVPVFEAYSSAVKDLHHFCLYQLQRLAIRFSDYLITIFEEVEKRIDGFRRTATEEQIRLRYSSILFTIIHRATSVDPKSRELRLEEYLRPVVSQWQDDNLGHVLSSFEGLWGLLGMGDIQNYIVKRGLHQVQDWSLCPLDEEGKMLQSHILAAHEHLPLRATKIMLSVSVERLEPYTEPFKMACSLWRAKIPLILPMLLQFLSHAHAFHSPSNWTKLPLELKSVVRRILTDRFWQIGISEGSRDEFYAKVGSTKKTVEGFASSIRATVRAIRETGYRILYFMSLLGDDFYGFKDFPESLSQVLFTDAYALSTHQLAIMVEMIRPVLDNCPTTLRSYFLTPMLAALFQQLDRKASAEWERIEQKMENVYADDNLAEEMRDESILRQLTFSSVMLVVGLLDEQTADPPKPLESAPLETSQSNSETTRLFILNTPRILKPVVLFCTHVLRMRDTRSCSFITRVLRSLIPEFDGSSPVAVDVREFISTEVLKACISSIHDPYFVDLQKDLAQLVASIITTYSSKTQTPRQILLSLPFMTEERVDNTIMSLIKQQNNNRQQRAIVLHFLAQLRGVSISEQGKILKPDAKKMKSTMQENHMAIDVQSNKRKDGSPDVGGLADMFGEPDGVDN